MSGEYASKQLRAILLEDDTADFEIIQRYLQRSGLCVECRRIDTQREYAAALSPEFDFIISDFSLSGWDAFRALELLRESGLDIPFLIVSGTISEDMAVECIRRGAADYLLKDRLARLPQAVIRSLEEVAEKRKAAQARETARELERLQAILDGLTEAVIIFDPQGRLQHLNPAAVRLYGFASPAEALKALSVYPLPLEFRDASGRLLGRDELPLRRVLRGETVSNQEMYARNPITGRNWIGSYSGAVARDSAGEMIHVVVTIRDITEQKRFEQELRESEDRFREAQKMESIGVLAGGIAHDFNNLLVGIVGSASLALEMAPADSPIRDLLNLIVKTGQDAARLTKQMLAYAGKGTFVAEALDLSTVVRGLADLVHSSISKKVETDLDLGANLPAIQADRSQVQQVFLNLALNAAEAIGASAGRITVRTGVREIEADGPEHELSGFRLEPGPHVFLEVSDTGCGMDEATRARIFEPFFSTKFAGRGLGLAAVSGIMRAHKGGIQVLSEPGKGSVFVALFPAAGKVAPNVQVSDAEGNVEGAGAVLVVDDEDVVRQVAKRSLELHGYRVLLAEGGQSALEILSRESERIRLVILDWSMPGMSGEETLPELLRIKPDLEIIVSSGYTEAETMRLFGGLRVAGFIQKPYTSRGLARRVKSVIP